MSPIIRVFNIMLECVCVYAYPIKKDYKQHPYMYVIDNSQVHVN